MIQGYNPGSNITILDTFYQFPKKKEDDSGYESDFISILYKDPESGIKDHQIIRNPDYEYFILDQNIQIDHNLFFTEKENVTSRMVPYSKLLKDIAEQTDNLDFYYDNIRNDNRKANEQLHTIFNIFNSDMNINDHYRFRFDKLYKNDQCSISKAYFDIEVDTIKMRGDFPELGECPINAVSYIYKNKVRSFLLRNSNNPLIEEFEKSINANLFKELDTFIKSNVNAVKPGNSKKYKLDNLEYEFLFYDEEICLIEDLFKTINIEEPDFLLAWNMAFDIPYIIERIYALGYNPEDIMCHPSFKGHDRVVKYFVDELHKNEYAERGDKYTISAHTVYLDQLIHFASRRKGQSAFPNFKLDTAGSIIADVKKIDYSHITTNISELPYLDYKTFVFYNIIDTIVQKCIEEEVNDINYIFGKCLINNTRYDKGHRQTVYLTNRATKEFDQEGYIIGNNVNKFNSKKQKFAGALVGDPTHNSDYSKIKLGDRPVNIINNLDDFDFKSLYPSIDREFNMAPNTQIGKIIIPNQVHNLENPFNFEYYDRGGQFLEDLVSDNWISFCNRWLHYPSVMEWIHDINEFFTTQRAPMNYMWDHRKLMVKVPEGYKVPLMVYYGESHKTPLMRRINKPLDYKQYISNIY